MVALGDGMNDVDMLEWAGLGVAVAEAAEPVRAAADLVVPRARHVPALLRRSGRAGRAEHKRRRRLEGWRRLRGASVLVG